MPDIDRLLALAPTDPQAAQELLRHHRRSPSPEAQAILDTYIPPALREACPESSLEWALEVVLGGEPADVLAAQVLDLRSCYKSSRVAKESAPYVGALPIPARGDVLTWTRRELRFVGGEALGLQRERDRASVAPRADLTRANLTDADLTRADLTRANLTDADLTRANLTDADLTRADLTDANLTRADLTDADLTRANLTRADLTDANLTDADLTRADLTDADLTRANLTRSDAHWQTCRGCYPKHSAATRWPAGWVPLTPHEGATP